jgi:hypothetical protein
MIVVAMMAVLLVEVPCCANTNVDLCQHAQQETGKKFATTAKHKKCFASL